MQKRTSATLLREKEALTFGMDDFCSWCCLRKNNLGKPRQSIRNEVATGG